MKIPASTVPWTIVLAGLALAPFTAQAQTQAPSALGTSGALAPGDEVRVYWYDRYATASSFRHLRAQTFDLLRIEQGQLVGRRGERIHVIETGTVRSLQRRIGTRPASAPAMAAGSAGGFAAAFVVGTLVAASNADAVNVGLSAGVLVGAPLGAVVAWLASRSRGIYEEVHLPGASGRWAAALHPGRIDAVGLPCGVRTRHL